MKNVIPLPDFGFLSITGRDALKFLQGYTTCDLEHLASDGSGLGATCNIQGRMLSNYRIVAIEQGFLLRMHRSLIAPTLSFLKKYIVFSKATLKDESAEYHCMGSLGELNQDLKLQTNHCITLQVGAAGPRYEHWCRSPSTLDDILLPDFETNEALFDQWRTAELNDGYVWLEEATSEEFIPQMLNLQHFGGISFTKGCYLGQEIVARMQYRGVLKRRLHLGQCDTPVKPGTPILAATGGNLGQIVAVAGDQFLAVAQLSDDDTHCQLESGEKLLLSLIA